jgi:hypothetical protein
LALGQVEELLSYLPGRLELGAHDMEGDKARERREKLGSFAQLLRDLTRAGVRAPDFLVCLPLGRCQCETECGQEAQFLPSALGGIRKGGERFEPLGEMVDRLQVGRVLDSALPRPMPVGDGPRREAGLGIVVSQEFRPGLSNLWKPRLQHLGNPLMGLLPDTLEH